MTELSITTRTVLPATAPFDLACSLRAMRSFRPCGPDQFVFDGGVRRAFAHPTDPARAVITEIVGRDDGAPGVALTIFSETPLTTDEASTVGAQVSTWLSLEDDRDSFLLQARADPSMARILTTAAGLHQVRFASLAEGAAFFMLTHNSTQWYAAAWKRRLAAHHGPRGAVQGKEHIAFPTLSTLTALSPEALTTSVGSLSRARRLHAALSGLAGFDEHWLHSAPFNEVRAALLSVKGIGPFTAQGLLLRVLGRPNSVPLEMHQFDKIATQVYGTPPPSPRELREWYGPNIGWWAYTARTALSWQASDGATATTSPEPSTTQTLAAAPDTAATAMTPQPSPAGPLPTPPTTPTGATVPTRTADPVPLTDPAQTTAPVPSTDPAQTTDSVHAEGLSHHPPSTTVEVSTTGLVLTTSPALATSRTETTSTTADPAPAMSWTTAADLTPITWHDPVPALSTATGPLPPLTISHAAASPGAAPHAPALTPTTSSTPGRPLADEFGRYLPSEPGRSLADESGHSLPPTPGRPLADEFGHLLPPESDRPLSPRPSPLLSPEPGWLHSPEPGHSLSPAPGWPLSQEHGRPPTPGPGRPLSAAPGRSFGMPHDAVQSSVPPSRTTSAPAASAPHISDAPTANRGEPVLTLVTADTALPLHTPPDRAHSAPSTFTPG